MRRTKYGFTLIEVLITMAIIGMLYSISIYGVKTARARARDGERIADLNRVQGVLVQYYSIEKTYPTSNNVYTDDLNVLKTEKYLTALPVDPINNGENIYSYYNSSDNFALRAKMEAGNAKAKNDNGKSPDYYETGNGEAWIDLLP